MNYETYKDVYEGNKSSDYQPTTTNPQATTPSLQQGTSGLQPTDTATGNDDVSQQRLPSVDGLKVVIVQDGSSSSVQLTPVQTATQTWAGPFWGCVLLVIIGIIVWSVKVLAKEEAPKLTEALEEAIKEPLLAEESVVPVVAPTAQKKKKAANKLPTKKTAKKKSKR